MGIDNEYTSFLVYYSELDLTGGLFEDGFFGCPELHAQFLDASGVIYLELASQEAEYSQGWSMTAFLDALGIDGVGGDVIVFAILAAKDLEDLIVLDVVA